MYNEGKAAIFTLAAVTFPLPHSDPIVITIQAFMQDNEVVPLSMTHQSLYVSVETQVAIAGMILAGVYVLIIFEVNGHVMLTPWRHLSNSEHKLKVVYTHSALSQVFSRYVIKPLLLSVGV